jgi:hypothetical protein
LLERRIAYIGGVIGAVITVGYALALSVPPAQYFPETFLGSFHSFSAELIFGQEVLPPENDPDWLEKAEPGDILFMTRRHVAWGQWSHVAVVVKAPENSFWVEPGTLAVLDASIHDGLYLSPIERYADWPRVVVRRASDDPEVRARIAATALTHRRRIFGFSSRAGDRMSSCTKAAIDALKSVGIDPAVNGWQVPDLLWRSDIWLD